jgi:Tfp pilus assembly protein PilV
MKNVYKNNEEGFTIVEVLIAMVLLLLMALTFTVLFTTSFDGIMTSGRRSEAVYATQQDIVSTTSPENSTSTTVIVNFAGLDPIEVQGVHETYKKEYRNGKEVEIDLFEPN